MAEHNESIIHTDIVIIGAGIAGLWLHHRLRRAGYDCVLLESGAIGSGQTIASQGIIHSGLKYALAGKINELAKSISNMPNLWRAALKGQGPVDLSAASIAAASQQLLIPPGIMGGITKLVAQKTLGGGVHEIEKAQWPVGIRDSGFTGSLINMDELVLDVASVIRALAEPYKDTIRKIDPSDEIQSRVQAKIYIYTAAGSNHAMAKTNGHDSGLETQARPLLMGLLKNAPFDLYAHLVGLAEKPVATITTHTTQNGSRAWYFGGSVAERAQDLDPQETFNAAHKALIKYLPGIDLSGTLWAALPIDRVEGKSGIANWMPDMPTIHAADNHLYCWPTKLTFAPLLSDMILAELSKRNITPSGKRADCSALEAAGYAPAPWDKAQWIKERLARQA